MSVHLAPPGGNQFLQKLFPMDLENAVFVNGLNMSGGSVAAIPIESVSGKLLMVFLHQTIARYFRNNRSRRNRQGSRIPFYQRTMRIEKRIQTITVDQNHRPFLDIRSLTRTKKEIVFINLLPGMPRATSLLHNGVERPLHRQTGRAQNIFLGNFLNRTDPISETDLSPIPATFQSPKGILAFLQRQSFRVPHKWLDSPTGRASVKRTIHPKSGGNHRSGKSSAARLIEDRKSTRLNSSH